MLAVLALAVVLGLGLRQVWGAADPRQAAGALTVANRTSAAFEKPAAAFLNDMGLTSPGDIAASERELVICCSQTLGTPHTALSATSLAVRGGG